MTYKHANLHVFKLKLYKNIIQIPAIGMNHKYCKNKKHTSNFQN